MAKWNLPVDDELDKQAFETAHDLRISKSAFIRKAVVEKIERLSGVVEQVVAQNEAKKNKFRIG